jgi:uncharacterized protein YjbJ (UPF0337 family)
MKASTKARTKGKAHELKGALKQKLGQLTNDPFLEAQGRREEIAGKLQGKIGQVKKVLGK